MSKIIPFFDLSKSFTVSISSIELTYGNIFHLQAAMFSLVILVGLM